MMSKLKQVLAIFKSINTHPLAGRHRLKAYSKFIFWQMGVLLNPRERKVAFTDRSVLIVTKGMVGATGNIYMGLHEFNDMAFLLHFLRKGDLFFDIGANIGSYMVLAAGHVGAQTFAFEPVPSTFRALEKNILANNIGYLATPFNVGVGAAKGKLTFTASHDSVNHVIPHGQMTSENTVEVDIIAIDELTNEKKNPVMVKIDVEGFEMPVITGMTKTLQNDGLKAIVIELNGSGGRYGYDEDAIRQKLTEAGFKPYNYDPFTRQLQLLQTYSQFNTLYVRNIEFVQQRLKTAEKISLFSEKF